MEHVLLGALRLGEGGTCSPGGIEVRRGWEHVLLEVLKLGEGGNMFSWRY